MNLPSLPHQLWQMWTLEPGVLVCLLLAMLWYGRGVHCLQYLSVVGRAIGPRQLGAFAAAIFTIVVALVSPLDALASALFSAHMVQHLLLVLVAAPLFVFAEPLRPALRALPRAWRTTLRTWSARGGIGPTIASGFATPAVAWLLHVGALFFWHAPAPYGWAIHSDAVHSAEHLSFLGTGVLFWWVALQPTGPRRLSYGAGVLYVSSAGVVMGVLGAILTFAPSPWYANHVLTTAAWHLTPLEDQQLAGVLMWAPASFIYLAAASFLMVRWIGADSTKTNEWQRTGTRRSRQQRHIRLGSFTVVVLGLGSFSVSACSSDNEPHQTVQGGVADRGKREIEAYGCGSCHVVPGIRTALGAVGPPLTAFGRRSFIAGELPNTGESLIRWIENPQSVEPGTAMPNLGVMDHDARDMAAYLYTLR